ncbi:MAG: hypothetical protein RR327_02930, partial [Clostridia bacterium]
QIKRLSEINPLDLTIPPSPLSTTSSRKWKSVKVGEMLNAFCARLGTILLFVCLKNDNRY